MNTLAIDVVLLPPEHVMVRCRGINAKLWEQTHQGFRFDETHLPHLTLLQQFCNVNALESTFSTTDQVVKKQAPIVLRVLRTSPHILKDGSTIEHYEIEQLPELVNLQRIIDRTLAPLAIKGNAAAYYGHAEESIRKGTIEWTTQFRAEHSGEHYQPHITLGVGQAPPLDEPFSFTVSRLAVCHLGNFNTCRKILWERTLENSA